MAFKQANSAGSTWIALKRAKISCRTRTSAMVDVFPLTICDGSDTTNNGEVSRGNDHWIAHKRNSSVHASSRRITWKKIFAFLMRLKVLDEFEPLKIKNKQATLFGRCPWCNGYRRRKWTRWHEFKSWTRLIVFHIALIPKGKVWIQLFSLQLWVNCRADWFLQHWWGN